MKRGFTLIETLISIAIIGLLVSVLVNNVDRSLNNNRLSNDAELIRSKIEEVRLMAGSTQQVDEKNVNITAGNDEVAFYALMLPNKTSYKSYILRFSEGGDCAQPADWTTFDPAIPTTTYKTDKCLIESIPLSANVTTDAAARRVIAFSVPGQRPRLLSGGVVAAGTVSTELQLKYNTRTAKIYIDEATGRAKISY